MDKLKALQYVHAAARQGSFAGAARAHDVSTPAVAKLIAALEKDLGIRLFERNNQGLELTAGGARYLEACGPAIEQIEEAERQARSITSRLSGPLVVAAQPIVAKSFLTTALPRFHARFPEISFDIRALATQSDFKMAGVDVALALGWPQLHDLICRRLGAGRYLVLAAPSYWRAHGVPQRPKELQRHNCIAVGSYDGALMDIWNFKRGSEYESVQAQGWIAANHLHRELFMELVCSGQGVMRLLDWLNQPELASGALVPALTDWESTEAVPLNIIYAPGVRRTPRVRAFIDFVVELFAEIESRRDAVKPTERPSWARRPYGRASDYERIK